MMIIILQLAIRFQNIINISTGVSISIEGLMNGVIGMAKS
jgi:hypothetical protein